MKLMSDVAALVVLTVFFTTLYCFPAHAEEANLSEMTREELEALIRSIVAETRAEADESAGKPLAGVDGRGAFLRSVDESFRIRIGGVIQPRYEYAKRPSGKENLSSFYLRRLRLDFTGHAFTDKLTFRVQPDLARSANLCDGWINYEFYPAFQVRFGQFRTPYQWQDECSSARQHFVESSLASKTFGMRGRDIGVMLHGRDSENITKYGIGIFDGSGPNRRESNSDGHAITARITRAIMGKVPDDETDLAYSEEPALAFAVGLMSATKNEMRLWNTNAPANHRADVLGATAGTNFKYRGFSLASDVFVQSVDTYASGVSRYSGNGFMLSTGCFLIREKLELVARYSEAIENRKFRDTRSTEYGGGVNIYHRGHRWKTRVQYLQDNADAGSTGKVIVEMHLQF